MARNFPSATQGDLFVGKRRRKGAGFGGRVLPQGEMMIPPKVEIHHGAHRVGESDWLEWKYFSVISGCSAKSFIDKRIKPPEAYRDHGLRSAVIP